MNERFDDGRFRKPRGAEARFRHSVHYTARTATPQTPLPTYRIRGQPWRSVGVHESWVGNPPPGMPRGSKSLSESREVAETATVRGSQRRLIRSGGTALAESLLPETRATRKRGSQAQTPPPRRRERARAKA